jgi:Tol biopolymer transport system component
LYVADQRLIEVGPSGRRKIDTGPYAALNVAVQAATSDLFMVAKHPGGVGLVRMSVDGAKPRVLVGDHVEPGALALSADASYVAVAGASDKGNDAALLLTSTEGCQVRRLAPSGAFAPRMASFHPGGRLLAFGSTRDRKDGELYLVQVAEGGGVERMTFTQGDAPAFSPDGRSLAWSSLRGEGPLADLYVARFLEDP